MHCQCDAHGNTTYITANDVDYICNGNNCYHTWRWYVIWLWFSFTWHVVVLFGSMMLKEMTARYTSIIGDIIIVALMNIMVFVI